MFKQLYCYVKNIWQKLLIVRQVRIVNILVSIELLYFTANKFDLEDKLRIAEVEDSKGSVQP